MAGIVEYMNQNGMDSSYNNRAKLAQQYGISNYKGTAAQNNQLLGLIKQGGNNTPVKDSQTISNNVKGNISASKSGYDYSADLNKDTARKNEMVQHLEEYMKSDPSLFKNRGAFESFFHYNDGSRDASQKALLDEYWNKANKYGLNSTENKYADDYASVAKQSAAEKQKNMSDALGKLYDMVGNIQDKFDGRMNALWNEMSTQTAQYLNEQADLKKMATDYYNGLIKQYNTSKGGQLMSTASRMSGSGLSYSAMASSLNGVENAWQERYNDALDSHINRLKDLSTTYNAMIQNIWNTKTNLTNSEKELLTDNLKTIWGGLESYVNLAGEGIDDAYSPYKTLTGAKISGATENATTESKAQSKQSEYEACTTPAQRADMLARNLQQVLGEGVYSTYYSQLQNAVNKYPNDFRKALYAAVDKINPSSKSNVVKNIFDEDTEEEMTTLLG